MQKQIRVLLWIIAACVIFGTYTKHDQWGALVLEASEAIDTRHGDLPEAEDVELSMMMWVKVEVEKAGLNWSEVYCLIKHESGWNDYAYNLNNNGTTDFGLWQINSIHKRTISVKDRWDYKTATKWAINKRLHDKNWSAWYGYTNNCI